MTNETQNTELNTPAVETETTVCETKKPCCKGKKKCRIVLFSILAIAVVAALIVFL